MATAGGPAFHLLPYHSLGVAACGQVLVALPSFSLQPLADDLGWRVAQVESLFVFFLHYTMWAGCQRLPRPRAVFQQEAEALCGLC